MFDKRSSLAPQGLRKDINDAYRAKESDIISMLLEYAKTNEAQTNSIRDAATALIQRVRIARKKTTGIDSFLTEYELSSDEGIALMCLAEALLRVPDNDNIDRLIKDKLAFADWQSHCGQSDSLLVNATTWALVLTGKILAPEKAQSSLSKALYGVMNRSSETVLRKTIDAAMRIMSKQFVMERTIQSAVDRAKKKEALGYRYSYDMLGEAALTEHDAERYFSAYKQAIETIGRVPGNEIVYQRPGISIKLSALHPRYNESQHHRVMAELGPKLLSLSQLAKQYNIPLTIDAEESERLDLSLDLIEQVFTDNSLDGWNGFGLAVQSYQKRAFFVIDWIAALARSKNRRIMVRLIKGAYWDSEIKKSQVQGFDEYPVFTRKSFTDLSFQACAKKILTLTDAIYPQFATHNAYSVALILNLVGKYRDFEFQALHGMGRELYQQIVPEAHLNIPCRIYAPVGSHEDLLPYLVRRLLENGANSSFVNRILDEKLPIANLVKDPVAKSRHFLEKLNQNIPLPRDIFMPTRDNSPGMDFSNRATLAKLRDVLAEKNSYPWVAAPIIAHNKSTSAVSYASYSPQDKTQVIGEVREATVEEVVVALDSATQAFGAWSKLAQSKRKAIIDKFADLLEQNSLQLMTMACLEAGKTWTDAIAEVREAIDFCRYYAVMAEQMMSSPMILQGYTGESNELSWHPRGVVLCISPWNFPLAIFVGQVVAALVTGNCVIAKPAEQTPLIAYRAVELMLQAGVSEGVIQLLPGRGEIIGAALVADTRIKAVVFTGSVETAQLINKQLAARDGEIVPLIAETGGQNAMIVDSSALLEQVTVDVLTSAFGSAGQRCSALRAIYIQDEIYPRFIELLKGAMAELRVGDPRWLENDVGPVIDSEALGSLQNHVKSTLQRFELIYQCELNEECERGYFMPPTAIAIHSLHSLTREVFGPVLHVIRYQRKELDRVIEQINQTGYGLTLGIHSRINETVNYIKERVHVGNCYVNRNMIGAVVGLQPFGGEGLSGTGPKAGGPHYLHRFCHERTVTVDTTAAGGNATLMSIPDGA